MRVEVSGFADQRSYERHNWSYMVNKQEKILEHFVKSFLESF